MLACRLLRTCDHAAIGHEILPARAAGKILYGIQEPEPEALAQARDGLQPGQRRAACGVAVCPLVNSRARSSGSS
jgi:hypothetical protein